jgi:hypothetical protein
VCNISLETCPPKSRSNTSTEGITDWCSAELRRPRFSFFIFTCQRTDTGESGIRLFSAPATEIADWPYSLFEECTEVRFLRSYKSERFGRQRRAALVVGVYSPLGFEVSTRNFRFLRTFFDSPQNPAPCPAEAAISHDTNINILCLWKSHCHQPAVAGQNNQYPWERLIWFWAKTISRPFSTRTGHAARATITSADHFNRGADGDERYLFGNPLSG